jgi:hypothetical protein
MPYKLNGKFVSKEKYDAAMAAESEKVNVSDENTTEAPARKTRTVDPVTSATARVRKAKRALEVAKRAHARVKALPDLDAAQAEYDDATSELERALYGDE